ncbi:MAG: ferrous iron transporter B, partial [Lachnospiraceae bacterium]|nr:ferrous iron transporter B [Lachnospiraceae bacterium]
MGIRIALAGNPNSGKTTLFNALTGSNQFVGNWPGVTVEKKEGKLKKHDDVVITDLPGIYSLSPYTLEEVVARNYLIDERPDAILNIIDGTNLERNLYLTTQLTELGIPVVIAINMMDIVEKNDDKINTKELSRQLGCKIMEVSALKEKGVMEAAEAAIDAAKNTKTVPMHTFSGTVEHALAHIEEAAVHDMSEEQQRWYAIKIFERDEKVLEKLNIPEATLAHIEKDIQAAEKELDDDAEAIITNERYLYITSILKACYKKRNAGQLTTSDKIDKVVTNRWLGLPIFAAVMFLVYWIAMVAVGAPATDWANDGLFGDGWHLFGIGSGAYEDAAGEYNDALNAVNAFCEVDPEDEEFDAEEALKAIESVSGEETGTVEIEDGETLEVSELTVYYDKVPEMSDKELEEAGILGVSYKDAAAYFAEKGFDAPDPAEYGVWVPGVPVLIENLLNALKVPEEGAGAVVRGLILDGIVAGVGAVLGFVPQMLVLFLMLAFLEACGYMARIAFVLDRIFRRFGLSGKSFIPMLIGVGCGVPGIMASRTIENERDRRMTIMTTTFIPCGAKLPFISMIAIAIFGGSAWIATSAYFLGMAAIIVSGIILKKPKMFSGDPAPFVMELPAYHWPTLKNVLRSMWERGWSFIKKAGTIILLSTILVWFTSYFGFTPDGFRMLAEDELDMSILAKIGSGIAWIFAPLGWGTWQAAVASITGLV